VTPRRSPSSQRGVALLLALLTMVLLTVVVLEFTFSTQVDYRRAAMWASSRRAAEVAAGGLMLASEVLRADDALGNTDSPGDLWARELPPIDTGVGLLSVRIEDEQGKINLNELATGALSPAGRRLTTLLTKLQLDPNLVGAVADWVDRNNEPGPGSLSAEAEWYSRLPLPYLPRNGPMRSYAELALVRGFTPDVLAKLRRFVTVLPDGEQKINVNTAPAEVLLVADPRLADEGLVKRIVAARSMAPFVRMSTLRTVPGMEVFSEEELGRLFTVATRWFRVRATGDVTGAMRSVEALFRRDGGVSTIVYLLPRRGPNIVGLDPGVRGRLDDSGLVRDSRR
jgi:general secretion pathway protein K